MSKTRRDDNTSHTWNTRIEQNIYLPLKFYSPWSHVSSTMCLVTKSSNVKLVVRRLDYTVRVVPLSLSPSCVTGKKTAKKMACMKTWRREAHERRDPPFVCFSPPGSRTAIFCVTHDGLSERGTTRSLSKDWLDFAFSTLGTSGRFGSRFICLRNGTR